MHHENKRAHITSCYHVIHWKGVESINSYIIWNIVQKETIKNHLLDCIHSDRKCATRIPESSSKVYVNCNWLITSERPLSSKSVNSDVWGKWKFFTNAKNIGETKTPSMTKDEGKSYHTLESLIVHIHIRTMSNWWNYHWRKVIRFCCQKNCIHSIIVIVDVWLVLIMSVFTINNEFELQKSNKKLEYECVLPSNYEMRMGEVISL